MTREVADGCAKCPQAGPLPGGRGRRRRLLAEFLCHQLNPAQRHREHPIFHQLLDHIDRHRMIPAFLRAGIEPGEAAEMVGQAIDPDGARFVVPMFNTAAGVADFGHIKKEVGDARISGYSRQVNRRTGAYLSNKKPVSRRSHTASYFPIHRTQQS